MMSSTATKSRRIYNYKVVATCRQSRKDITIHQCNSQAEVHRVYMATLQTGRYSSVYWTYTN